MARINSKNKGSSFEREVAKKFSEWSGKQFNRTPMSGALRWDNDTRVISDIVPPQEFRTWPFSIECKKVEYDWDFSYLLKGTSTFWDHWSQASGDAERESLIPLLVFSKNRRETFVGVQTKVFNLLYKDKPKPSQYFRISNEVKFEFEIIVFKLDDFLKDVTLTEVLTLTK